MLGFLFARQTLQTVQAQRSLEHQAQLADRIDVGQRAMKIGRSEAGRFAMVLVPGSAPAHLRADTKLPRT
jgi:hypothetical protein